MTTLYCGTGNPGKLREFRLAIKHFGGGQIRVESVPGLSGVPPCEETGTTFEENAVLKAAYYSRFAPGLLFADDSGLQVDALGGAPGVSSARFSGPDATDETNNQLLLEKLRGIEDRTAQFVCVIALAKRGSIAATFRGVVKGHILHEPRGKNGFGYDPLFFHPPFGCTFGEATNEQKLEVSHRGHALAAMVKYVQSVNGGDGAARVP